MAHRAAFPAIPVEAHPALPVQGEAVAGDPVAGRAIDSNDLPARPDLEIVSRDLVVRALGIEVDGGRG